MKNKNQKKKVAKILGLDYLDFSFTLNLTSEEASELSFDIDQFTNNIDLESISKNPAILDKITVSSNSSLVNNLLYVNKTSKSKTFIELASFNSFQLKEEEKFFKEVITYVTEHNFIFISEGNAFTPCCNVPFNIKLNGLTAKTFMLGTGSIESQEKEEGKEQVEPPKREINELLTKLSSDFQQFDYILIDLNSIIQVSDTPAAIQIEEIASLLETVNSKFNSIRIIVSYPSITNSLGQVTYSLLASIGQILCYTDFFLFEKRESLVMLNLIHQMNNPNFKEEKAKLSDSQFEKLFTTSFETNRPKSQKQAIFNDEYTRLTIIEFSNSDSKQSTTSFPTDLYPKVNHNNQKLIEEYKKIITLNKDLLKSTFYGTFVSRTVSGYNHYSSLQASIEITQRVLELLKLELPFPIEPEFYIVSTKKANQGVIVNKKKEENFKLDCVNINKSKLSTYNPLTDNNLHSFFSSNIIRKHLKNSGFINTKGFILEDPEKKLKSTSPCSDPEKNKKLLIAVKESEAKQKISVRNSLIVKSRQLHDPSIKDLERQVKIAEYSKEYNMLLPSYDLKSSKLKPIKGYTTLMTSKSGESKVIN